MMESETKPCPYCGEEILAIAKKCKHCGEWLDGDAKPQQSCPICGEDNPVGTKVCQHCGESLSGKNSEESPVNTIAKSQLYESLSVTTIIYTLILWVGGYAEGVMQGAMNNMFDYEFLSIMPYSSLLGAILIVGIGIKYSKKFTSPVRLNATLRAWIAIGIAYMWWPLFIVLTRWLMFTGILDTYYGTPSPDIYMSIYFVLVIAAIVVWCVLKFGKKRSIEDMLKWFTIFTLASSILIALTVIMQFGITSIMPGNFGLRL